MTGDVNVRLDRPTDPASVRFKDLLESFALTQRVTVIGRVLDIVATKSEDTPSSLQVDDIGISQYHLIINVRKTTASNYVTSERLYGRTLMSRSFAVLCNNLLAGYNKQVVDKLQRVLNCAARVIFGGDRREHV